MYLGILQLTCIDERWSATRMFYHVIDCLYCTGKTLIPIGLYLSYRLAIFVLVLQRQSIGDTVVIGVGYTETF